MPDPAYEAKFGKGPHLTADAVVVRGNEIALVRRRKDGMWALPGGFLDPGETFEACALREFKEEAGVQLDAGPWIIQSVERPVAFDRVDRDPRSRIITGAVLIRLSAAGDRPELIAGDDADDARWFDRQQVPQLYADHNDIIDALVPAPPGQIRLPNVSDVADEGLPFFTGERKATIYEDDGATRTITGDAFDRHISAGKVTSDKLGGGAIVDVAHLRALIDRCRAEILGDDEFALLSQHDGWEAHMCHKNSAVHVGESGGKFCGIGKTPEEAVSTLLAMVRAASARIDDQSQNRPGC